MNPESLRAMAGDTQGGAPTQTPAESAPSTTATEASVDVPEATPEPSAAMSDEASPELLPELTPSAANPATAAALDAAPSTAPALSATGDLAPATESSPAVNSVNKPELSPAANSVNTPELSPAACGARLAELFPALFLAPGAPGPAKPIKLRIHADIQARAPGLFTKRALGIFFSRYTTTNAYLKALANAPHRFDLDGQPAGEIAAEHSQAAAEELARRHALAAERRAAQRPPRPAVPPTAEGQAHAGAEREARQDRRRGPRLESQREARPDAGPGRRQDGRPARPAQQPQGGGQRFERANEQGRDGSPPPENARPPRPPRPPRHADRPPQGPRPQRPERALPLQRTEPAAALPVDPAQRERAVLLRSFESSPLSKANFCALKGMTPAALDAALAQAQAERDAPSSEALHRSDRGRGR